jgi:hypothetical protein
VFHGGATSPGTKKLLLPQLDIRSFTPEQLVVPFAERHGRNVLILEFGQGGHQIRTHCSNTDSAANGADLLADAE